MHPYKALRRIPNTIDKVEIIESNSVDVVGLVKIISMRDQLGIIYFVSDDTQVDDGAAIYFMVRLSSGYYITKNGVVFYYAIRSSNYIRSSNHINRPTAFGVVYELNINNDSISAEDAANMRKAIKSWAP